MTAPERKKPLRQSKETDLTVEVRLDHLEVEVKRLLQRLDETVNQTSVHAKDLAMLGQKIDAMREDLKEIKLTPQSYVPRSELEARLKFNEEKIQEMYEVVKHMSEKLHNTQVSVNNDLHKNTTATYGTLLTSLLTVLGIVISFVVNMSHK
jgi:chromosome segregation ATPase